jgi:transcriptional regulator of acetoin/glycerol metabolism
MDGLAESAFEAHRRYVSTGRLVGDLLRESTLRAWERAHRLGADARLPKAEHLGLRETERLLGARRDVLAAAEPYLHLLSRAAGEDRHAAMLGDASGVVLRTLGDERTIYGPEPFPSAGALLDEGVAGANGIGTPLAEGDYVELVGPEHFIEGFHAFTCQGIPVHGPSGERAGVVSVSVRRTAAAARLRRILVCSAKGIEAELLRGRVEEDVRRVVAAAGFDEALVETLRQDLVQSAAAGRLRAESAARGVARDRLSESARLLALAERSIEAFRRQAAAWFRLASSEPAPTSDVALHELVDTLAELGRTEASTRLVDLHVDAPTAVYATADVGAITRALFGGLLRSLERAGAGGRVILEVRRAGDTRTVRGIAAAQGRAPVEAFRLALPGGDDGVPTGTR